MSGPVWKIDLVDLDSTGEANTLGKLTPFEPTLSFAINRPPSLTCRIRNEDPLLPSIDELTTRVKARRSPRLGSPAVLKMYNVVGPCVDVFGDGGLCNVTTLGPLWYLMRRYVRAETVFAPTDQHAIAKAIIDAENARYTTQIRTSEIALPAGPARAVTVAQYKQAYQAIADLGNQLGGFEFDVLPVEGVPGVMGDFRVHYPQQGVENLEVFIEHGQGKRNVIGGERSRDVDRVTTDELVLGRTEGASTLSALRSDAARRDTYRALLDSVDGFTDISEQAQLDLLADELIAVRAVPRDVYTLNVAPTFEFRPFDDFDLGDRITARISEGRVQIDGTVRVWGFEVQVLATGEERLTQLTIVPEG